MLKLGARKAGFLSTHTLNQNTQLESAWSAVIQPTQSKANKFDIFTSLSAQEKRACGITVSMLITDQTAAVLVETAVM